MVIAFLIIGLLPDVDKRSLYSPRRYKNAIVAAIAGEGTAKSTFNRSFYQVGRYLLGRHIARRCLDNLKVAPLDPSQFRMHFADAFIGGNGDCPFDTIVGH